MRSPRRTLTLLLGACASGPDLTDDAPSDTDPVASDPTTSEAWLTDLAATGPFHVGFREIAVDYTDAAGNPRHLRTDLWYPTDVAAGPEASYLGGLVPAPGVLDAPPPAGGTFPLVVFSHGHQGGPENLSKVLTHLVSHGWVAVAPEHTGNTSFDSPQRTTEIYWQRPADVRATLDEVLGPDPIADHLDGRVLGVGHSFGGYTMHAVDGETWDVAGLRALCEGGSSDSICSSWDPGDAAIFASGGGDDRVSAFVAMSAGDFERFGDAGVATAHSPMLLLTGSLEPDNPTISDGWFRALPPGPHVMAEIAQGDHMTYTDYGGVDGFPATMPGHIDGDRGRRITAVLLGAWGAARVLDKAGLDGLLDGSVPMDDAVTLTLHDAETGTGGAP